MSFLLDFLRPRERIRRQGTQNEMLYLIGLGLSDEKDVTVRGLEAIKGSSRVYLEAYTSILGVGRERLVSLVIPPPRLERD